MLSRGTPREKGNNRGAVVCFLLRTFLNGLKICEFYVTGYLTPKTVNPVYSFKELREVMYDVRPS